MINVYLALQFQQLINYVCKDSKFKNKGSQILKTKFTCKKSKKKKNGQLTIIFDFGSNSLHLKTPSFK